MTSTEPCKYCRFDRAVPDFPNVDDETEIEPHDYKGRSGEPIYGFNEFDGSTMWDWWEAVLYKAPNGGIFLLVNNGDGYWIRAQMLIMYCPKCGRKLITDDQL